MSRFLSIFPYKKLTDQLDLKDLDCSGLPVSFVEDYKVVLVLETSSKKIREIAAVWLFDDKYLVSSLLLSMSKEFFLIHQWVSKRIYNGNLDCFTILDAAIVYAYMELSQDETHNAGECYSIAKEAFSTAKTIDELNKEFFCIEESERIDDLEFKDIVFFNNPVEYNDRYYFLMIPWVLYGDDRFELKAWDLLL